MTNPDDLLMVATLAVSVGFISSLWANVSQSKENGRLRNTIYLMQDRIASLTAANPRVHEVWAENDGRFEANVGTILPGETVEFRVTLPPVPPTEKGKNYD